MFSKKTNLRLRAIATHTLSASLVGAFALSGCGKKDAAAAAASNLVGKITVPSAVSLDMVRGLVSSQGLRNAVGGLAGLQLEVDPSTLHLSCLDNAHSPSLFFSSAIAADGSFSLDLTAAGSDPVNCDVKDAANTVVASLIFTSTGTSMGGTARTFDTFSLQSGVDLGTVTLNTVSGEATANGTLIGNAPAVTVAAAYDFTGDWTIGNVATADLPTGYGRICTQVEADAEKAYLNAHSGVGPRTCDGPVTGMNLFLKRLAGKTFTPDATCAAKVAAHTFGPTDTCGGTTGTDDAYGVMVWIGGHTAFESCGSRLGFNYGEAKAEGQIDLTGSGVTQGAPAWSTSVQVGNPSATATLTEGWKLSTAKSQYDLQDGGPVTEAGQAMWIQWDAAQTHYMLGLQNGGCTLDATGANYQPSSWGAPTSCDAGTTVSVGPRSLRSNSCHFTGSAGAYTCVNVGGGFTAGTVHVAAPTDAPYVGSINPHILAASGTACPTDGSIASVQCLANAYYNANLGQDPSICVRELRTDWTATDPTRFIVNDGPLKAKAQAVLEKGTYTNANTIAFRQVEHDKRGVQSNNVWIACDVQSVTTISFAHQDGTNLMKVKFVTNNILNDTRSACVAASSNLGIGTSFRIFTLTKI